MTSSADEEQVEFDLIWLSFLTGQCTQEALSWYRKTKPGFENYLAGRVLQIFNKSEEEAKL